MLSGSHLQLSEAAVASVQYKAQQAATGAIVVVVMAASLLLALNQVVLSLNSVSTITLETGPVLASNMRPERYTAAISAAERPSTKYIILDAINSGFSRVSLRVHLISCGFTVLHAQFTFRMPIPLDCPWMFVALKALH